MSGLDPHQQTQSQSAQPSQSQSQPVQSHESGGKTPVESNESQPKQSQTAVRSPDFSFLGPLSPIFENIFQFLQRIIMIVNQIILRSGALG